MAFTQTRPYIDRDEIEHLSAVDAEVPCGRSGQNYAVIIYVGPNAHQKCEHFAINFVAAFPTNEDAHEFCKKLHNKGWTNFTTYVIPMNRLIPFPPPSDKDIEECIYPDNILNQLMDRQKQEMFAAEDRIDGRVSALHKIEAEKKMRELGDAPTASDQCLEEEKKLLGNVSVANIDPDDAKTTHINKVRCIAGVPQSARPNDNANIIEIKK